MTAKEFYRRFITVHKCGGCGQILSWDMSDEPFCEKCRVEWNEETVKSCGECFLPVKECGCMPTLLEKAGALTLRKLFFYLDKGERKATMGLIYWIKHRKNRRMTGFVGERLSEVLKQELEVFEIPIDEVFITYVPRGKVSYRTHGFDQSQLICRSISENTGIELLSVFRSAFSRKLQKELDGRERVRHARDTVRMKDKVSVSGRYAVLVDDIVTTGASMSVCTRQLMKAGARGVICLCIANRQKSPKNDRK